MNTADLKKRIDLLLAQKERIIIAIDGSCTAGKPTLSDALSEQYDCCVFHMDDFFLRPEQRPSERFAETGGNVDMSGFKRKSSRL